MTTPTSWPAPPMPILQDRPEPRRWRVRRAIIAVLFAGAVGAALGIDRPFASLGIALIVLVTCLATSWAGSLPWASRGVLAVAVLAFTPWWAVRSSPWLLVPDMIAVIVLVVLGLSTRNGAGIADSIGGYIRRVRRAFVGVIETPAHVHLGLRTSLPSDRRAILVQSALPLAVGIAAAGVVAAVLASGDALFASYVDLGQLPATTAGRFLSALTVMAVTSAATGISIAAARRPPIPARRFVSTRPAIMASAPLCLVYVSYVAVQVSSVALGASYVNDRTGLTYAEYARSGFFQLVAVAVATFVGMVVLRPTLRSASRRDRTALLLLVGIAAVCTMVMAVAAIIKLQLYADAFGLTMLRLYTMIFAGWLLVAIVVAFASLVRPHGEWVVPVVAATALCGVLAMNVVNPERVVAEHNLTATIDSPDFDIGYLTALSDDVVPTVVEFVDRLDESDRASAIEALCRAERPGTTGADWNRSRAAALRSLAGVCRS